MLMTITNQIQVEGVLDLETPQLLEPQPAESRPAVTAFVAPALDLWNAKWVLLKKIDVHLFIKHLQTNSPQKGDAQEYITLQKVTAKNDPPESTRIFSLQRQKKDFQKSRNTLPKRK